MMYNLLDLFYVGDLMELLFYIAEIIGTIAFTISGSMVAIEKKMDLLGVIILGSVTAFGGGFLRDIILNFDYPSVFNAILCPVIAVITSIIVFIICYIFKDTSYQEKKWYLRLMNIIDSIGLGIFVVIGAKLTMTKNNNVFLILFCAVITGVGGGAIRDMMAIKIPDIFRKHIYAVAALFGAILFYILIKVNLNESISTIISVVSVIIIRFLAYHYKWNLPRINISKENLL